ncbi:MAG: hypothetical protein Q8907_04355 [Bacteroidota bacterium]|nr:hypothetical protein [Bacteroidota bacterium]
MNISKNTLYLIGLIIMTFTSGCEYQINKVYTRDVNKNVALPDFSINLNLNSDTVYVYNYVNINCSLKLTNKRLYSVKFYLNDSAIEVEHVNNSSENNYSFCVDMSQHKMVKVRAEIYTSTGTGSIADKVNAESFVIKTKEWVIVNVPDKLVLNTEIVDGRLKLTWTPIKTSIKGKYKIQTSCFSDSTYNNWYIDSSYFGGYEHIDVSFNDNGLSRYHIFSEINFPYPKVHLNNRDSFLVYWDKCKFYNSIKGYRIRIDTSAVELYTDTSFVYKNGKFGNLTGVILDLLKKNYIHNNSEYLTTSDVYGVYPSSFLGNYTFYSSSFFPLSGSVFYYWSYANNRKTIYKFSLDTKSIANSRNLELNYFSVSPNNKYILCDVSTNLVLLNSNDLSQIKSIPVSNIVPSPVYFGLNISDIGTTVFYDYLNHNLVVYDLINDLKISEIPVTTYVQKVKISSDGQYVFEPKLNTLYRVGNHSYAKIWTNENQNFQFSYYEFSPENPNQIALYDGTIFYLKNCSDFSTLTSFPLNNTQVVNVDFANNKILTYKNYSFYVYSLIDGKLLNTIQTTMGGVNEYMQLFDDYIFSNSGQLNLRYL